jgi:hypothetical protein
VNAIVMPAMTREQEAAWHGLLDLSERVPEGWTLVGGQMVHLHCAERGFTPHRSTPDVDAVVDARRVPKIFATFTRALEEVGFQVNGETMMGKQHRWVRGEAMIDVLIPQNLGRAAEIPSASGKPGLETPGAQFALDRSERVEVEVGSRSGRVARPSLVGAVIAKSAAYSVTLDRNRARHLDDICVLSAMLTARDLRGVELSKKEREYLRPAVRLAQNHERISEIDGAPDGISRVLRVVDPA